MRREVLICACVGFALAALSGCSKRECSISFTAMDTYMEITAYTNDDSVLEDAKQEIEALEGLFSVTEENSEIYAINHAEGESVEVSEEAYELLELALDVAEKTEGAFDPTVYPLVEAWGFTSGEYRIPETAEIERLLTLVDYTKLEINKWDLDGDDTGEENYSDTLPAGMELDLGAIAKGYAGDAACALLADAGVDSALLYLGGNIQVIGTKPDGSDWRIGIQEPEGDGYIGILSVSDTAVVTSGGYERYFTGDDGKIYWHILNPSTGYPADSGLISVTIIADSGAYADALSTAVFVMGFEAATELWRAQGGFEMVLLGEDGKVYVTDGIYEAFELENEGYTVERVE